MFRPLNITVKGRMETYLGEQRIRYFALKVIPSVGPTGLRHVQDESRSLLDRLKIYENMPDRGQMKKNNDFDQQMEDNGMGMFGGMMGGTNGYSHGGYM